MTSVPDSAHGVKRAVGRPRHYDEATERELIYEAAYRVLRDQRDTGLTIADVLREAGVSTRSFYRHFTSKDELLCAMYLRDAGRAAARIAGSLADATSPVDAVSRWVDAIFAFKVGRRAERITVLASITAARAEGFDVVAEQSTTLLVTPLIAAIQAGIADGSFTTATPHSDAHLVSAAVFHAAGIAFPQLARPPASGARDEVLDFCLRALGASR